MQNKNTPQSEIDAFVASGKSIKRAPPAHVGFNEWQELKNPMRNHRHPTDFRNVSYHWKYNS
jgi:hypothetical protein